MDLVVTWTVGGEATRKGVKGMERKWETPAFEEVRVSAEATAYMGIWESDWT